MIKIENALKINLNFNRKKYELRLDKNKMQSGSFLIFSIAMFYSFNCIGAQYVTRNPLNAIDKDSYPDPWVILVNDTYFYCGSEDSARLYITFSENLQDILTKQKTYIYTPPPGFNYSQELWAPELHFLQNRWYVYFAADDGRNENHRMFVLEGNQTSLGSTRYLEYEFL